MKPNMQDTQTAFMLIERLAPLAATPNITSENVAEVNRFITQLLKRVIEPSVNNFLTEASGLKL